MTTSAGRVPAEQLIQAARQADQRGDRAEADALFERALGAAPHNPAVLNAAGVRALGYDRPAAAEALFRAATAADPGAPALWMNLADACRRQGDDAGERGALTAALDGDQRHLGALIRLAQLHERLGEAALANARWSGVLMVGGAMTERAPQLDEILRHADAYVRDTGERFAAMIDDGLAGMRTGLEQRDRRRVDGALDALLGRRRIYHNVCEGLHVPFLPADEFFDRAHFPWFAALETHTDAIREELLALIEAGGEGMVPYVSMDAGTPANKWSALDRNLDWSAYYLWRFGEQQAEAQRCCPRTVAALAQAPLAQMPRRAPTAFFSILKPGTRLPAHTGVSNARAIVHLPLIVPAGCGFRVGGETREWRVGEAFAFDDTIEHEAWNDSAELRAVLILDVWNPHLTEIEREQLVRFFEISNASGLDPATTGAIGD